MNNYLLKRIISLILVVSVTTPLVTNHVSASTLLPSASNESQNTAGTVDLENNSNQISDDVEREKIIVKTENSTTYQRTDGSKEVVMYSSDVRYRDEQNKLIDYDPSLVEITDDTIEENNLEGYLYENKQGDAKQYIPTYLSEETPVLLKYEDYQVTLRPIFANENIEAVSLEEEDSKANEEKSNKDKIEQVLEKVDQDLLPEENDLDEAVLTTEKTVDIYDKVKTIPTKTTYSTTDNALSLEYISQETGIKENIILNEKPDTNVFLYELKVNNAYPRENGIDSGITFYDNVSNDIVGNIPAPFMNDATNNAYSEDLSFSIGLKEGTDDTYILALTVDSEYLNSPERQYPVTIDPSYIWTGGTDVADTYVLNGTYENTNFYSSAVTTSSVGDGSQGLYRTYIRFADFLSKLSGYYVDSAKLTMYETGSSQANNTIQVHRVTEDWSKTTVNWNNRPGYSTTPITSVVTSGTAGKAKTFDITSYARQVANGTYSSYGIMLRANDESSSGLFSQFYSSRYSNESLRPKLSVIYYDGPTTASSVTLKSAYIKPGAIATINWSGINSQSLNMVQYHIYNYDDENATLGSEIIGYSSSTKIGTTSSGSSTIPATASLSEGCYRIYVRGVDNGGIKGAGKGVTLHIDGTNPSLSKAELSPNTTSVYSYSNQIPDLNWSGGDDHFSHVEYSINNGLKKTSTSRSISLPVSSFTTAGVYTINVRAFDKAGNYSAFKKLNYYYDPNVSNSNIPEITKVQFTNTTKVSPDITITSSHPDGTSVAVSKVYYYMAASTSTTEPTDDQYVLATNISNNGDVTNLRLNSTETSKGNGVYKLYIKIQDVNNNTSEPFLAAYYRMVNVVYDNSVTLAATYNESDNVIAFSWNGDSTISSVKLYKRYGEDSFKYGQTISTGTSVNMSTETIEDTADFRLLVTYLDGSQKASNIVSVLNESQIEESSETEVLKYTVTTLDSDVDNIEDGYEIWQYNTDYLNDDTDNDNLIDGYELNNFDTNPLLQDSDQDGFNDGYEVFILGTDPTVKTEASDSDNDGINNLLEYNNGTNPYLKDSDFDGFEDMEDTEPLVTSSSSNISPNYDIEVNVGLYDRIEENSTSEAGVTRKTIYNFSNQIKEVCDFTSEKILRKTYYFYDNNGNNTVTLTYADGKYILNTYSYKQNHLSSIYHNGFHYDIHYNENNDVSNISIGNQTLLSYQYNANDDQIGIQYANNQTKNMVYNENGYLESIENNGNLDFVLEHDENGNIMSLIDKVNDVKYTYTYDLNSKLIGVSGNNGFSIAYDTNSSIDQYSINSTTSTSYSDNGVIRTQQSSQNTKIINEDTNEFTYSTSINLISGDILSSNVNTKGNSSTSTLTIKQSNESIILSKTINKNETSSDIIYKDGNKLTYGYDRNGNIVSISKNGNEIASYIYDGFNQLTRENDKTSEKTFVYTYDNGGNILKRTDYSYTIGELGTALNSTLYEYNNNVWNDMLTSFDNQSITYDNMGNPINYRNGINLTWTNGRMLDTFQSNDYTINYKYDMDGLRTEKTVKNKIDGSNDKTLYYYDNGKLIEEKSNENTIWYIYDVDDTLVGFELNGITYYYETNLLKDITKIYNRNGVELVSYSYDAYGNITNITGDQELAKVNPFRYRSYYYDNDSEFYYLCTRYYDPVTLRFLNADDTTYLGMTGTALSNNLFSYCENDPVNGYDPYGVWKVSLADMGYFLIYVIGFNPIGTTLVGITVYKLSRLIAAKMALLGFKLGGYYPPLKIALGILGGVLGLQIGSGLAGAIWDCINLRKKYIDFSIKYNSWGIPYKIAIEAK